MEEREVKKYVAEFLDKHDFTVKYEQNIRGYKVDVLAEKNGHEYFIECKGDSQLRSHEIHVMVGQIVSEMHKIDSNIHFCLAMPFSLATYLRDFGIEGIKALRLNLFVIGQRGICRGDVFYLNTEDTIRFIQVLREDPEEAWEDLCMQNLISPLLP